MSASKSVGACQRQFEIVRKRRRNFVVFRRWWVTKSAVALLKKSVHDLLFLTHITGDDTEPKNRSGTLCRFDSFLFWEVFVYEQLTLFQPPAGAAVPSDQWKFLCIRCETTGVDYARRSLSRCRWRAMLKLRKESK